MIAPSDIETIMERATSGKQLDKARIFRPSWFPLDAMWWGVAIVVLRQVFEVVGKLIPYDATNPFMQGLRMVLKVLSGYLPNKTTK